MFSSLQDESRAPRLLQELMDAIRSSDARQRVRLVQRAAMVRSHLLSCINQYCIGTI